MDDAEGVEEGVDHVDHEQEEGGRREQRKDDGPEPLERAGAVDRRRLEHRFRNHLESGQEEQEVVGDLLPGRRHHHQKHGLAADQHVVPLVAQGPQPQREDAVGRAEQEQPEDPGHRGRDRIGPQQRAPVNRRALYHPVRQDREQEPGGQREKGGGDAELGGDEHRFEIMRIVEQFLEVLEPDELTSQTEGILHQERLKQRLAGRPYEEDKRDDDLRRQQHVGQPGITECYPLLHGPAEPLGLSETVREGGAATYS